MKISTNLKKLLEKFNLNTLELSRRTGISQPVIYRLMTGETHDPKLSTVLTLANYFDITLECLIGETVNFSSAEISNKKSSFEVPLLTWKQAVNHLTLAQDILSSTEKTLINFKPISNIFALKTEDDSMLPIFPKGTLLIVNGDQKHPQNGNYIIAKIGTNKKALFRQFIIDNEISYLKSLNPDAAKYRIALFDKKKDICCGVLVQSKVDYN